MGFLSLPNVETVFAPTILASHRWKMFRHFDFSAINEHLNREICPHHCLIKGDPTHVEFSHYQATLHDISFNVADYGMDRGNLEVFIPPTGDIFLLQFVLSGTAQFFHQGKSFSLGPGSLAMLSPHSAGRQVGSPGCRHLVVRIPRATLEDLLAADLGRSISKLYFHPVAIPLAGPTESLARLIWSVCLDIGLPDSIYHHGRAARSVCDAILRLVLAAIPHNYSQEYAVETPSRIAPFYVRRAEEYIHAHFNEPVTLDELVTVSGVSARSLQSGFRNFRNVSPMGYLKNYRLDRARQLLGQVSARRKGVTQVALEVGVLHTSKFAKDYRDRFGELPSQTMLQSAGTQDR